MNEHYNIWQRVDSHCLLIAGPHFFPFPFGSVLFGSVVKRTDWELEKDLGRLRLMRVIFDEDECHGMKIEQFEGRGCFKRI